MIAVLLTTTKKLMNAIAVGNGSTVYSDSVELLTWSGFTAMEIVLAAASNVTISQQCSNDNSTWYDPVTNAGVALSVVYTSLTASAYVIFDPSIARYVRFKVVGGAASTVTLNLVIRE